MIKNKQTFSIRETAETLVPDKLGRTSYLIAMGMIVLMVLIISIIIRQLPSVVPLYYTLPWGEARLAPRVMLYILPLLGLLFMILNVGLARMVAHLSAILPKTLAVSTAVIVLMLMFSLLGIIQSLTL